MTYDILDKSTEFSRDFEVDPKLTEGVNKKTLLNKTIDFLHEELNETNQAIKDNKDVRYLLTEQVHKYIDEMNFYR